MILYVCAIGKKNSEQKKKIPFSDLRFFYLSQGEEKGKKEQYTHRANSNLSGESIAREKERVLLFINRGGNHPSFTKSNTRNRKAKREA